jgi:hypothetical protein
MKKSISILGIALMAFSNLQAASIFTAASISNEFQSSINVKKPKEKETKFVSSADANLIVSELGSLQKYSKTIDKIILDDAKIIQSNEAPAIQKPKTKKQQKKSNIKMKRTFNN